MKTMDELQKQFDKEERVWEEKLDALSCENESIIGKMITDDLTTEQMISNVDMAMNGMKEMQKLTTKHTKFLLKWNKKFRRRIFIDTFKNIIHKGK